MEFRLIYEGSLKSSGNSTKHVKEKHAIRKEFHKQLSTLWGCHQTLQRWTTDVLQNIPGTSEQMTRLEIMARQYSRFGYRFVPLVSRDNFMICGLDILFLRRENPGDLILRGGDIDNRIKTLLDALRMPDDCNEVFGSPEATEDPFFCLLQNDSLVTELNVLTDRLLTPLKEGQHENEVVLVIKVKLQGTRITGGNSSLVQ